MGAVSNHRRRAVEAQQANSVGGLLTRLDLLAQRRGANVVFQHTGHKWVLGVEWEADDDIGGGHARVEGPSAVSVLTDVLDQVHA